MAALPDVVYHITPRGVIKEADDIKPRALPTHGDPIFAIFEDVLLGYDAKKVLELYRSYVADVLEKDRHITAERVKKMYRDSSSGEIPF